MNPSNAVILVLRCASQPFQSPLLPCDRHKMSAVRGPGGPSVAPATRSPAGWGVPQIATSTQKTLDIY